MKYLEYVESANKIKASRDNSSKKINIAILRSYTCESLEPILVTMLFADKFNTEITYGSFNQYSQEILDENSFLYKKNFDLVILLIRPQDIFPQLYTNYYMFEKNMNKEASSTIKHFRNLLEKIQNQTHIKAVIISTFEENFDESEGIIDYTKNNSMVNFLKKFNMKLVKLSNDFRFTYVMDINNIIQKVGMSNMYDFRMWYLSKNPYTIYGYEEMGRFICRIVKAIYYKTKKMVVLDLDNTLYGGIIGEDGVEKVLISNEYPGNCYRDFQIQLKKLKERGILLAIVSKNNFGDVEKLFAHPHMVLKKEDFVEIYANWEDKYINIKELSKKLNLGLDSFVFIDDSSYEIDYVKSKLPEIEVLKVPNKIYELPNLLKDLSYFDKLNITDMDRNKTELYSIKNMSDNITGNELDDFLRNLDIKLKIKELTPNDLELNRASEMTLKTNQFNMTTKRYTVADMQTILLQANKKVIMVYAKDKYGNHGSVGLVILDITNPANWEIDTFLLSCRVIKRKIEYAILEYILNDAKETNVQTVSARFVETEKNKNFKDFYKLSGGILKNDKFYFNIGKNYRIAPDYINIEL